MKVCIQEEKYLFTLASLTEKCSSLHWHLGLSKQIASSKKTKQTLFMPTTNNEINAHKINKYKFY